MKNPATKVEGTTVSAAASYGLSAFIGDVNELVKMRLTFLVLCTTAAGFYMGATSGAFNLALLGSTLLGTAMVAGSVAALNQYIEREADRRMHRTEDRPLAASRLPGDEVVVVAASVAFIGVIYLAFTTNILAAALAAATGWLYLFVYTPMKMRSPLNTLVGAVPGAIPPVIGWVAATGSFGWEALALFGILFFWQMPHFMAIAWLYREDYARAGFQMIPLNDPTGQRTGREAVLHAVLLLFVGATPFFLGINGWVYLVGSTLLGGAFAWSAMRFLQQPSHPAARKLFLTSILYLPLLLILMTVDKV